MKKKNKIITIQDLINEAIDELEMARVNESNADPEFIEVAIEATNVAKMRLNNLIKRAKMEYSTN